ncbi:hypothetical protein [Paenibacillus sp. DMB5]|uniref:hypothetical protein n=1 Tax=Paenibacillus sp. DMB5 TaxID=1780103 RepID=UPI000FE144C1|nr:hypothetical protein [Paenibacillus sp. DMB5]
MIGKNFNGVTITDTLVDLTEQKIQVGVNDLDEKKKVILEKAFNSDMLSIREPAIVSDDLDRNSFSQGTNNVGGMGARVYGGNVDAATIGTTSLSYSNDLYTSSSRAGYFDAVQANDFVGNMVCMSGASSATNPVSCGTVLSKSVSYSIDGVAFSGLRSASYTSAPGDSGAPTYYSTVLMGVNKGRHNGNAVYSYIGNVLNALPVQPILN